MIKHFSVLYVGLIIDEQYPVRRNGNAVHDRLKVPSLRFRKPKFERVELLIEDRLEAQRVAHVRAAQVLLVGRQPAVQSKITNGAHGVEHRRPDLDPELPIDDLLEWSTDLELPQHLPHRRSEVLASKARYVRRRDGEQELLSSGPSPGR